jgi:hypothetical protein
VYAAIQHADGIGTHYLWMDKALAELLGRGLLLASFLCFVPDLLLDIFKNSNLPLNKDFKLISKFILPRSLYAKSSTAGRSS